MTTLRAAAAAIFLVAGAAASPALAQTMTAGNGSGTSGVRAGSSMAAPERPGTYSGPRDPSSIGGPYWSSDDSQWRGPGRNPCGKRRRCRDFYYFGHGYGGISHDRLLAGGEHGYYSQVGRTPRSSGGQAHFDYDRGYPYEYYAAGPEVEMSEGRAYAPRVKHCTAEATHDRRTGRQVTVRICRN